MVCGEGSLCQKPRPIWPPSGGGIFLNVYTWGGVRTFTPVGKIAMAEHCDYGTLKDEMIRDRIVVGLLDAKLSGKVQLDAELTLIKAVTQARQSEAVKKQQTLLRSDFKESGETKTAYAVKAKKTPKFKSEGQASGASKKPFKKHAETDSNRCGRCGKSPSHARTNCPAKDATCHKCNMRGHWGAVCRSQKTVGEVEEDDYAFLGEIGSGSNGGFWSVDLRLNNSTVRFKIDTGVDVTI